MTEEAPGVCIAREMMKIKRSVLEANSKVDATCCASTKVMCLRWVRFVSVQSRYLLEPQIPRFKYWITPSSPTASFVFEVAGKRKMISFVIARQLTAQIHCAW